MAEPKAVKEEYRLDEDVHKTAAAIPPSGDQLTVCPRCNHALSAFDSHDEEMTRDGPKRMHRLIVCFDFVKADLHYAAPGFDAQEEQKPVREAREARVREVASKPRELPPESSEWTAAQKAEWERKEKARQEGVKAQAKLDQDAKTAKPSTPPQHKEGETWGEPKKVQSEAEETKKK